jgi:O-antigen/teichoic acid export membrane protein
MDLKRIIGRMFSSHLLFTLWINIVLAFLSLASGGIAARILGVIGRGQLAAIQLWPTFLAGFSMLGLSDAIVYFSAKESQKAGNYVISAMVLILSFSLPFMGLGYLLIPFLLNSQTSDVVVGSRIYLLAIPLFSLVSLPLQALRGRKDMKAWNLLRLLQPFGWTCILIYMYLRGQNSAREAAFGYLWLVGLLFLPIAYIVSRRIARPYRFDWRLWSSMLRFGIPSIAASLPSILNLRLDQMVMAAFLAPQVLGLYVVAVAWAGAVSPLLDAISITIFPQVASQITPEGMRQALLQGIHLAVLAGIVVAIVLLAITPVIIPLIFGGNYKLAIPASLILIIAGVISSIGSVMEGGVRGLGKPSVVLASESAGLIVTILALAILLRPFGIIGASLASLLGYSSTMIALLIHISRIINERLVTILLPKRSDVDWILKRLRNLIWTV